MSLNAQVVKLVDTPDLGSGAVRCVGSSPILGNSLDGRAVFPHSIQSFEIPISEVLVFRLFQNSERLFIVITFNFSLLFGINKPV